jgi:hypothetical protein
MLVWFKKIFLKIRKAKTSELFDLKLRVLSLEKQVSEVQDIVAHQAELLAIVANIQQQVISLIYDPSSSLAKKEKKSTLEGSFIIPPTDDDLIN